jgi:glycine/D-amino acid oxidase-like deaminating enzyme
MHSPRKTLAPNLSHPVRVIGSGVIGTLAAIRLAKLNYPVTIYDTDTGLRGGTSSAAVGQFLPYLSPTCKLEGDAALQIERATKSSRQFYERLSHQPSMSGVMRINNVELVHPQHDWPEELKRIMNVEQITTPPLTMIDHSGAKVVVNMAYLFDTYSINVPKTLKFLHAMAAKLGVQFVNKHILTPEDGDISDIKQHTVVCAGLNSVSFSSSANEVFPSKGYTLTFGSPDSPAWANTPPTAISFDDMVIIPREDGTIVAGGLNLKSANPTVNRGEVETFRARLIALSQIRAGNFVGLPVDISSDKHLTELRAGTRSSLARNPWLIAKDPANPQTIVATGFGGIGWSVGPGVARQISRLVSPHSH